MNMIICLQSLDTATLFSIQQKPEEDDYTQ